MATGSFSCVATAASHLHTCLAVWTQQMVMMWAVHLLLAIAEPPPPPPHEHPAHINNFNTPKHLQEDEEEADIEASVFARYLEVCDEGTGVDSDT